jgi:hypothetical protein
MLLMALKTTSVQNIFSIDLRSLAFYRIFLGIILLSDAINRISLVPPFYSDSGISPRSSIDLGVFEYAYHFHLMMISGEEWFSYLILSFLIVLSLLLIAGYKTKPVLFMCWFLFCSLSVRNSLILHAGDTLLTILLFWGLFLPLAKVFSLDAKKNKSSRVENCSHLSMATIGLYIQFVLIYVMNGLYKGEYINWLDGSHLYYTFSRFEYIKPFALLLYPFKDLLSFLTQFSLYLELFGPLLFFIPFYFVFFRMTGIILFIGLQLSILLTLNIGLFPIISITGILVFIPSEFWDGLRKNLQNKSHISANLSVDSIQYTFQKNLFLEVFLAVMIVYTIIWNVDGYSSKIKLSEAFKIPGNFLKIDQKWALFSSPQEKSEYITVYATYDDGTTSDLFKDFKTGGTAMGQIRYARYNNYRWRIFVTKRIGDSDYSQFLPGFIDYLISNHGFNKRLNRVDIIPHQHFIKENYNLIPLQADIIYTSTY